MEKKWFPNLMLKINRLLGAFKLKKLQFFRKKANKLAQTPLHLKKLQQWAKITLLNFHKIYLTNLCILVIEKFNLLKIKTN